MSAAHRILKSLHNRAAIAGRLGRGALLRLVRAGTLSSGRGLSVGPGVDLQIYGELQLGRNVTLSPGCFLSVGPNASLRLGDDVFVGRHTVIVAATSISIGLGTDIAEHCSIRDSDHAVLSEDRASGLSAASPVVIGRRCWIGAGVRILRGVVLGDGVTVGANAVVRESFGPDKLIAGIPARLIRDLRSKESASGNAARVGGSS